MSEPELVSAQIDEERRRIVFRCFGVDDDDAKTYDAYIGVIGEALQRRAPDYDLIFDYSGFPVCDMSDASRALLKAASEAYTDLGYDVIVRIIPEEKHDFYAAQIGEAPGRGPDVIIVRTLEQAHAFWDEYVRPERDFADDLLAIDVWPDKRRVLVRAYAPMRPHEDNTNFYSERIGRVLTRFAPKIELIIDYSRASAGPISEESLSWMAGTAAAFRALGIMRYARIIPPRVRKLHDENRDRLDPPDMEILIFEKPHEAYAYFDRLAS